MGTLHLNLHKKWFDMVASGKKKEEYRELSDYWKTRMKNVKINGVDTITFSNGYAKNRPQIVVELLYISIRPGLVEWGAVKGENYFVLHLGKILNRNETRLTLIEDHDFEAFFIKYPDGYQQPEQNLEDALKEFNRAAKVIFNTK